MAGNDPILKAMLPGLAEIRSEIWVADDNADVRLLLKHGFRRSYPPVVVEFFSDGAELVARVRQGHATPKVLLLDYDMPELNGVATVKTLRVEGWLSQTVVVMFSGNADNATVSEAYSNGIDLFLHKPRNGNEYVTLANLCAHCLEEGGIPEEGDFSTARGVTNAFERLMQKREAMAPNVRENL